ncbi:hypothetical protein FB565_007071 [Actinoplanes lutulentus]|uniref:Sugar-binding cellulase-like protein n=1 Tax=Actinoplanes lutulentus TaxID=1287878 RepID=A0A327ZIR9_9ACTN|nr:cellulase-like family protein [Actinoplanes lutulentus]MBB2947303.1 hypothetical protein [Actinoplanes lutulentus]RAK36578.1 sugar-binding cellulase-like protein [Actinoplanes lutulentus]
MPIPDHLPRLLTISLWDFSWYTRTGPGEPFVDLDTAFAQAVDRGYNTVRICAMPYLLFGSGLDTTALTFTGFGNGYGQGTRWYDLGASATLDGREHLLDLFRAAHRHDCHVILSSWEYQQSPAFLADDSWHRGLSAVPPHMRVDVLADALADCVDFLIENGLDDRIAFVEIHNEVQLGGLTAAVAAGESAVLGLRPLLERGIDRFRNRHPTRLITANYAGVPVGEMRGLPRNADVAVFHPYVYGVLGELIDTFALRDPDRPFPQAQVSEQLLLDDAPLLTEWAPDSACRWKFDATMVGAREVYAHDWCDPDRWDRWLYERYAHHRCGMAQTLSLWIAAAADWAADHDVPLVFGEGWVGYTPLRATFEDGPVGAQICREATTAARQAGAWGAVVCSNAAPHHPMWSDVALQAEINAAFAATAPED